MSTRIGVDVGGTFTDLVFYDEDSGTIRVAKTPTTSDAPEVGVENAVVGSLSDEEILASRLFVHGTTVGLNSLIERSGPPVGLLCTDGFRDILEIKRGDRAEMYNLFWRPPAPLVPRHLRIPIRERMMSSGAVMTPLREVDVATAARVFQGEGVVSVAVAFLNAYANGEHERAAERVLRSAGFEGDIALSHRVSGEYREFERTSTVAVDAYVRPVMRGYLEVLKRRLGEKGFSGQLLVTRSGGGAMTFHDAEERSFETILSGPVAGAQGAGELARKLGLGRVISADVGGTSFDTCLVLDGRPRLMYEGQAAGLPIQAPWVDVRSIGAGGGSVAFIDNGGLLAVGPRSAGSIPGPACYGRGGAEPTVTDAALVLGMLPNDDAASGIQLDVEQARAAMAPLASELALDVLGVAQGIIRIVGAHMAGAIREITVGQGYDPREATLMAFGGAGPIFATILARELDVPEIVIPPHAGNFSAWGLLGADLTHSAAKTRVMPLSEESLIEAQRLVHVLLEDMQGRIGQEESSTPEAALDMRYVGQEYALTIPVEAGGPLPSVGDVAAVFTERYERAYGHPLPNSIEIVSVRAGLRIALPPRRVERPAVGRSRAVSIREAYSMSLERFADFKVLERSDLDIDAPVEGPALVVEPTTTTYVDTGYDVRALQEGALLIRKPR